MYGPYDNPRGARGTLESLGELLNPNPHPNHSWAWMAQVQQTPVPSSDSGSVWHELLVDWLTCKGEVGTDGGERNEVASLVTHVLSLFERHLEDTETRSPIGATRSQRGRH